MVATVVAKFPKTKTQIHQDPSGKGMVLPRIFCTGSSQLLLKKILTTLNHLLPLFLYTLYLLLPSSSSLPVLGVSLFCVQIRSCQLVTLSLNNGHRQGHFDVPHSVLKGIVFTQITCLVIEQMAFFTVLLTIYCLKFVALG